VTAARQEVNRRPFVAVRFDDDGPGLPAESRAAALARGGRLDETKPGSGLGLSIVVELARIYGGGLELGDSDFGGLRATLTLPAPGD
jgi:signal transduction histidine kinase